MEVTEATLINQRCKGRLPYPTGMMGFGGGIGRLLCVLMISCISLVGSDFGVSSKCFTLEGKALLTFISWSLSFCVGGGTGSAEEDGHFL